MRERFTSKYEYIKLHAVKIISFVVVNAVLVQINQNHLHVSLMKGQCIIFQRLYM